MALTYFSKIELRPRHRRVRPIHRRRSQDTETDVDTPQSVTLDFQTGVAPKTLVFGSIRWVDWSEFAISPPLYEPATAALLGEPRPLVDYADDWWTYNLGVGRQLTDDARRLALAHLRARRRRRDDHARPVRRAHHRAPRRSATTTARSTSPAASPTACSATPTNLLQTDYNDGSVWGAGLRVGYTF